MYSTTAPHDSCITASKKLFSNSYVEKHATTPHLLIQLLRITALLNTVLLISPALPHVAGARPWSIVVPSLEYYVQVGLAGSPDLGALLPAIDSSTTQNFGQTQLFSFNVTQDADASSKLLGFMRGYTVQASYTSEEHGVEVEVLSYDDGSLNGTISLQGLINAGTNEIAVVGGTGNFRGTHGYGIVTLLNSTATLVLYHHELYFL